MSYALNYTASPTVDRFLGSRSPRKILAGPVGGGKTSACVIHTLLNAMQQEPDEDGFRRSRHIVVRNTIAQLRQTVIKTFTDWLPPDVFGRFNIADRMYYLNFKDVRAEILFLALEDEVSLRQLLSLEATTIFLCEMREISQAVIEGVIGSKRVGRYPSRKQGPGATYPCIIADTNMPAFDTYHQKIMDGDEGDWVTFRQPGGRTPEAENLSFLPPDYYNTEGLTEEYIRTMIDCEFGQSREGMPVFRQTFVRDFHVAKEPLLAIYSPDYPLLIGLDAGLTPAAIIGQLTPKGQLNILGECYTPKNESIGMERFLTNRLKPMLANKFGGMPVLIIVDPAANQPSQASEETVLSVLEKSGLKHRPAGSNKIEIRIGSAETMFGRQAGGKAGMLIDAGCTGLINALSHAYKFAARKDGDMEEKPLKDHPHSDIGDGFTYLTSYVVGTNGVRSTSRREVKQVSMAGWC